MRNRLAPFLALLFIFATVAAACGNSSSTTTDPYQVVSSSTKASWNPVQINVGVAVKDGATTVTVDPSALGLVIDSTAKTAAVHVSLPTGSLGLDAATLSQLGVTGSTLDLDVVYDGQALYGRSPLFASLVTLFFAQSGDLPKGDLTGWLRFGTKDDLAGLAGLAGGSGSLPSFAVPSFAAPSFGDAASVKSALESAGVSLTIAGTEKHDGADAYHLKAAIDATKLLQNKALDSLSRTQLDQVTTGLQAVTLSADLWVDKASNHLTEFDLHVAGTKDTKQTADITVKLAKPDGTVLTTGPATFVDVPIKTIVGNLMTLLGQGLTGA